MNNFLNDACVVLCALRIYTELSLTVREGVFIWKMRFYLGLSKSDNIVHRTSFKLSALMHFKDTSSYI